jgi:hypothetical protein
MKTPVLSKNVPVVDPTDPASPNYKAGFPVWAIVIIIIAGVAILVGIAVFLFLRSKRNKGHSRTPDGAINEEILE